MATVLSIAFFGAAGCLIRYWLSGMVNRLLGSHPFPLGTLVVNLVGAFFIGLIMGDLLMAAAWASVGFFAEVSYRVLPE